MIDAKKLLSQMGCTVEEINSIVQPSGNEHTLMQECECTVCGCLFYSSDSKDNICDECHVEFLEGMEEL